MMAHPTNDAADAVRTFFESIRCFRSIFSELDLSLFRSSAPSMRRLLVERAEALQQQLKLTRTLCLPADMRDLIASTTAIKLFKFTNHKEDVTKLIILLDNCYYNLYYFIELSRSSSSQPHRHGNGGGKSSQMNHLGNLVPAPHKYFTCFLGNVELLDGRIRRFMEQHCSAAFICAWNDLWGVGRESIYNPLIRLQYSRWREITCILSSHGLMPTDVSAMLKACRPQPHSSPSGSDSRTMKGCDPLVPPFIRDLYDSCRVWPCHFYAFATPSEKAITKLRSLSPIVEIGAGTGYWAHVIQRAHAAEAGRSGAAVEVLAYDKNPPTNALKSAPNEYHGRCRAWTTVLKGGAEVLHNHHSSTLLLCYPPPDSSMALDALRTYKGSTVAYVGEWQGDTGTRSFEALLSRAFFVEEVVQLPNWGDTCYSLMVWRRKDSISITSSGTLQLSHPYRCSVCGLAAPQLHRCRLSYAVFFCGALCARKGNNLHRRELALRHLLSIRDVQTIPGKAVVVAVMMTFMI